MRGTHRVVLELEVEDDPDEAEPEDWDLQHLNRALRSGVARPLRTLRGLVVGTEHDRLSNTLEAIADDVGEAAQLHWLAIAQRWPLIGRELRSRRPTLEVLIELERFAALARRIGERLHHEGL
jgi:hypothetical protein